VIVYVETNFVLAVALRQEDYADCNRIVELSKRKSISLVVPAFSLAEPFGALKRDHVSVRAHLASATAGAKCFVTKDKKDFDNPDLRDDLKAFDCRMRTTFADGLQFIMRQIADGPTSAPGD
jgi:hypothetical protein